MDFDPIHFLQLSGNKIIFIKEVYFNKVGNEVSLWSQKYGKGMNMSKSLGLHPFCKPVKTGYRTYFKRLQQFSKKYIFPIL
jgi:hypothetical protein